jgi:transcriptional regulator with XRE-family HTH domain
METIKKNEMIVKLMALKGVNKNELAVLIGKSSRTIDRMIKEETAPSEIVLHKIADALKIDRSYWDTGIIKDISIKENPWKDEAYMNLKKERDYFKQRYEMIFDMLMTGKKPQTLNLNFLKTSKEAGFNTNLLEVAA